MFLLVPAYPGNPGPRAVNRLCVCLSDKFVVVLMFSVVDLLTRLS